METNITNSQLFVYCGDQPGETKFTDNPKTSFRARVSFFFNQKTFNQSWQQSDELTQLAKDSASEVSGQMRACSLAHGYQPARALG